MTLQKKSLFLVVLIAAHVCFARGVICAWERTVIAGNKGASGVVTDCGEKLNTKQGIERLSEGN